MSAGSTYRRILLDSAGGSLEGVDVDPVEPDPDDLLQRLHEEIDYLEHRLGQRADPQAVELLTRSASAGLHDVLGGGTDGLTAASAAGLEAVVHSDGSRPVLFVDDDFVDVLDPAAAAYATSLSRVESAVRQVCRAVGRVEDPSSTLGYQGTAWAVDEGVVVTNYHVLQGISVGGSRVGGVFSGALKPGIAVDFGREVSHNSPRDRRFPVRRVLGVGRPGDPACAHPTVKGINFDALDVAVLELEPVAGQSFPSPVTVARGDDPRTRGRLATKGRSVYLVGFPGRSQSTRPDVFASLFSSVKGVKRLTPGLISEGRGDVAGDDADWVIGHDASTLGGSSGSLVVDLETDGRMVLGLHFAGLPDRVNWAHALEGATGTLAAVIPGW